MWSIEQLKDMDKAELIRIIMDQQQELIKIREEASDPSSDEEEEKRKKTTLPLQELI